MRHRGIATAGAVTALVLLFAGGALAGVSKVDGGIEFTYDDPSAGSVSLAIGQSFIARPDEFSVVEDSGSTTLPVYIYSMIRRGLTPEINAVSTVLLFVSVAIVTAYWVLSTKTQTKTVH